MTRWVTWVLCLCLAGCSQRQSAMDAPEPLLPRGGAWVMAMGGAHGRVDGLLAEGRHGDAVDVLHDALDGAVPSAISAEHRRIVHQDLFFRLASVQLLREEPTAALAASDRGLTLGRGEDLFTANLLITRGQALEAMDRGKEAATSYYGALEINERLLKSVLGDKPNQPEKNDP